MTRFALSIVLLAVSLFSIQSAALACGGVFCSQPPSPLAPLVAPEPVDQSAERIVFQIYDGLIEAHIHIQYEGSPEAFAWIIPVDGTPQVGESSLQLFEALDWFSRPTILFPTSEPCEDGSEALELVDDGGGGCGGPSFGSGLGDDEGGAFDGRPRQVDGSGPVTVYAHDMTDNYEYHILGAEDLADLYVWLQDNDYNVAENMIPAMEPYARSEMRYVALKIRSDKKSRTIQPLKLTFEGDSPVIPIKMTAVAAQPLMGIQVFILADEPYVPANYQERTAPLSQILFDETGRTNYFEAIARSAAEVESGLFIREYRGPNEFEGLYVGEGIEIRGQILSRFYTRLNPHQMTEDPAFKASPGISMSDALIDLSDRPPPYRCRSVIRERLPSACAFTYCGLESTCAVRSGHAVCQCQRGEVVQAFTGPDGTTQTTCMPATNPLGVDPGMVLGTEFDPCNTYKCDGGLCILRGGFPACSCPSGEFAQRTSQGMRCVPAPPGETFGPGAGGESAGQSTVAKTTRQRRGVSVGLFLPLFVLLGLKLAFVTPRVRRREDQRASRR